VSDAHTKRTVRGRKFGARRVKRAKSFPTQTSLAEIGFLLLVEICRIAKVVEFVLGEPRRRDCRGRPPARK